MGWVTLASAFLAPLRSTGILAEALVCRAVEFSAVTMWSRTCECFGRDECQLCGTMLPLWWPRSKCCDCLQEPVCVVRRRPWPPFVWCGSARAIDADVRWPPWQEVHDEAAGEASSAAACPAAGGDVQEVHEAAGEAISAAACPAVGGDVQEVHEAAGEASSAAACPAIGGDVMNVRGNVSPLAASPKEADEEEAICGAKAEEARLADGVPSAVPMGASNADTRVLPTPGSPELLRPISCPRSPPRPPNKCSFGCRRVIYGPNNACCWWCTGPGCTHELDCLSKDGVWREDAPKYESVRLPLISVGSKTLRPRQGDI